MEITRRQGRVVLVGYVKLDIHPKNFLYREIDLRYSRAYGPGQLPRRLREGPARLSVRLRTVDRAAEPCRVRTAAAMGAIALEPLIGGVYHARATPRPRSTRCRTARRRASRRSSVTTRRHPTGAATIAHHSRPRKDGTVGISLIGFGNHALAQHLPNLRSMRGVEIRGIASATGRNAAVAGAESRSHHRHDRRRGGARRSRDRRRPDLLEPARALRAPLPGPRREQGRRSSRSQCHPTGSLPRRAPPHGRPSTAPSPSA